MVVQLVDEMEKTKAVQLVARLDSSLVVLKDLSKVVM